MSLVHLHLLMNHVPVIGVVFVAFVLLAALRTRNTATARLGLLTLAGVAAVTVIVFFTGEPAEDAVEHLAGVSRGAIHEHEELAQVSFIAASIAGVLALALLWFYRRREIPRWVSAVSLVGVLGVAGLMGATANLGGQIRHSEIRAASAATDSAAQRGGEVERDEH